MGHHFEGAEQGQAHPLFPESQVEKVALFLEMCIFKNSLQGPQIYLPPGYVQFHTAAQHRQSKVLTRATASEVSQ